MRVARSVSNFTKNYREAVSSRLPGPPDRTDTLLIRGVKYGDWTGKFGFPGNTSPSESLKDVPLRPSGISC